MIEFKFPSLGADMDEGTLVTWLINPGDVVHKGDIVAEVETDKGLVEIETWQEGVVDELLVEPSRERLPVGTLLARFRPLDAEAAEVAPETEAAEAVVEEEEPTAEEEATVEEAPAIEPKQPPVEEGPHPRITPPIRHLAHQLGVDLDHVVPADGKAITRDDVHRAADSIAGAARISPRARRLAEELGVDVSSVTSSRPDGLITFDDLHAAAGLAPAPTPAEAQPEAPLAREAKPAAAEEALDRVEAMRRAITRSMTRSKREIPHYYLGTHIDLAVALSWMEEENEQRSLDRRLLPAALLLRATALALREVPELNGHFVDDEFRPAEAVHLGVAVSLREGGLVAPAIHDADKLSLDETMEALRDLVTRARTWRIRSSEMSDPTVTVTNLGDRGVETAFPVIIPPQVAIIGFGRVVDQPVAIDGMLAIHPVVHATLAGDHRVTDGHRGGVMLGVLDRLLQEPQKL
jgi:pyruvate dehydrogenase E2 component (dihydrolipoamide acetyltransferase)